MDNICQKMKDEVDRALTLHEEFLSYHDALGIMWEEFDELKRDNQTTISWIPSSKAKLSKIVDLKDENGIWTKGWIITQVYSEAPEDIVLIDRDAYRKHRDRTDI